MASIATNRFKADLAKGVHNWAQTPDATYKIGLIGDGYTPNPDHNFVVDANPTNNELSGTGYAGGFAGAGRKSLAGRVVTQNDSSDRAELDANDVTWSGIDASPSVGTAKVAAQAFVYKPVTSDADSLLCCILDFPNVTTNGGDFTLQFASNGLINIT